MAEMPVWKIETSTVSSTNGGVPLNSAVAALLQALVWKFGTDGAQRREGEDGGIEVWIRFNSRDAARASQQKVSDLMDGYPGSSCAVIAYVSE